MQSGPAILEALRHPFFAFLLVLHAADRPLPTRLLLLTSRTLSRMNAACMAVQTFIGADGQPAASTTLFRYQRWLPATAFLPLAFALLEATWSAPVVFACNPVSSLRWAGQIVKTYDCEDFEEAVAACPVPIVVAGGKKLAERDALQLLRCYPQGRRVGHGPQHLPEHPSSADGRGCPGMIVHEGRKLTLSMGVLRGRNSTKSAQVHAIWAWHCRRYDGVRARTTSARKLLTRGFHVARNILT